MANLYTGSGAESNRSDNLLLLAKMTVSEGTADVTVKIDYTINKTTSTGFTKAGTRYGILVKNATVNSSGQLTSAGTKIASAKITTPPDGDSSGSVSFTFKKGSSATTYSGVTFLISDQDAVTRSSDTTYLWTGQKGGSVSALPSRFAVSSFTVPVGYTSCGAPTFTSTSQQKKRNESFTLTWNAGTAGTNVPISKYRIYMRYNSEPTTSAYSAIYETTGTSYNLVLEADVGNKYYFKVQTIGSVSGYDSALSTEYTMVEIVNTAPTLSEIELDYTTLPYNGGSVKATFTASDPNSQTIKYQYRTSADNGTTWDDWSSLSDTNPQTISLSGISQSASTNKTYSLQFRANDGVDNSDTQSATVTVLAAPQPSLQVTPKEQYSCVNGNYYKIYELKGSYQRTNGGTYTFYLMTGENYKKLGTSKDGTYKCDIMKYSGQEGYKIYFGVSFSEEISYGNNNGPIKWNTNNKYSIPKYFQSDKSEVFNTGGNTNVFNENYFYNKLRFYFYNDNNEFYYDSGASLECYYSTDNSEEKKWIAITSGITDQVTSKTSESSGEQYVELDTNSLSENKTYSFKILLRRGINASSYATFSNLTKVKTTIDFASFMFLNNESKIGQTIYPHRFKWENNNFVDSVANVPKTDMQVIQFSAAVFGGNITLYGLNDNNQIKLCTKRVSGEYQNDEKFLNKEYELGSFIKDGDYYKYNLQPYYYNEKALADSTFYGLNGVYLSVHEIRFWVEVVSSFGYTIKSDEIKLNLDFRTPLNITKASFYLDNEEEKEEEIGEYLYEGEKIKVKIDYESFTDQDYYYTPTLSLPEVSYSEKIEDFKFTPQGTMELGVPIKVSDYILGSFSPLPEFRESINTKIQLKIESSDLITTTDTIFNSGSTYTTIKHINSNNEIIIDKGEYTDDNPVGYITLSKVKTGDLGVQVKGLAATDLDGDNSGNNKIMSINTVIQYSTDINFSTVDIIKTIAFESYSKYGSFQNTEISNMKFSPTSLDDWKADYYYMRLKTITTNPISRITKECYSNIIVVYNISPTISYRKNHLGINYNFPTSEPESVSKAILVIGQTSGRNEIVFNGNDYGKLLGFSASGGTWDN